MTAPIKLSDYVMETLVGHGIRDVFLVTGGGAMHLDESAGKHPGLRTMCFHHEQACAMAAESYARLTGRLAAVLVTSGPGGTNAITGVLGAWLDSIPMIVISGQVRYDTSVRSTGLPLRQLGDQEFDIARAVQSMTKYAIMVTEPETIRYHLERALHLASAGRPGPCWLDIPMNVQGAFVESGELRSYAPDEDPRETPPPAAREVIEDVIERLKRAQRPVILAGSGIRVAGAHSGFLHLVDRSGIPVVTAWNAHDLIPDAHPLSFGRPGTVGDRAGNFIVQNADLLLVLGCRLNIRQIGYSWKSFAREAFKIVVDIDPMELQKPTVHADLPIHADVGNFMKSLERALPASGLPPKGDWLEWCRRRKARYPVVLKGYWNRADLVNPYCFMEALGRCLPEGQITVTGDGSACVCAFQAMEIKSGQRLYTNSGCAAMGYDLPAAIGACVASDGKPVVCLAGDGSLQMNLQELQTVVHHRLPIKLFVLNNNGYHSIRQTQEAFFPPPRVGCDPASGVSFPDMEGIARAYGLPFARCRRHADLEGCLDEALNSMGPFICEIMLTPEQPFAPKVSSKRFADGRIVSRPLEDMAPFLDRSEFLENMIIKPLPESLHDDKEDAP